MQIKRIGDNQVLRVGQNSFGGGTNRSFAEAGQRSVQNAQNFNAGQIGAGLSTQSANNEIIKSLRTRNDQNFASEQLKNAVNYTNLVQTAQNTADFLSRSHTASGQITMNNQTPELPVRTQSQQQMMQLRSQSDKNPFYNYTQSQAERDQWLLDK